MAFSWKCVNKKKYKEEWKARRRANRDKMDYYKCRTCYHYHITAPKEYRKRR